MKLGRMLTPLLGASLIFGACGTDEADAPQTGSIALGSVVISPDGSRKTYVQTVVSLEDGPFDTANAIEIPGHNVMMARPPHLYVGLMERPVWQRYTLQDGGGIALDGEVSFVNLGVRSLDYGNVIVDEDTAVSVIGEIAKAIVWNPKTMQIVGEVALEHLQRPAGYMLESFTVTAHEGRVYIPGRWTDWLTEEVLPGVSITVLDPDKLEVVGVAADDRCTSGGSLVFDEAGYGYVIGDGRNWCAQLYAEMRGEQAHPTCLLRIAPGATDFEESFYISMLELTGGHEAMGEMETAVQGSGVGFSKIFHRDQLPEGVEPAGDFAFWSVPAYKAWRIELGDSPVATEVEGMPFAALGFAGSRHAGKLYTGESPDGSVSEVFAIDPATNSGEFAFRIDGYFVGLYELDTTKVD